MFIPTTWQNRQTCCVQKIRDVTSPRRLVQWPSADREREIEKTDAGLDLKHFELLTDNKWTDVVLITAASTETTARSSSCGGTSNDRVWRWDGGVRAMSLHSTSFLLQFTLPPGRTWLGFWRCSCRCYGSRCDGPRGSCLTVGGGGATRGWPDSVHERQHMAADRVQVEVSSLGAELGDEAPVMTPGHFHHPLNKCHVLVGRRRHGVTLASRNITDTARWFCQNSTATLYLKKQCCSIYQTPVLPPVESLWVDTLFHPPFLAIMCKHDVIQRTGST